MAIRINPAEIAGTTAGTGDANAFGPYRFRGGQHMDTVRVSGQTTVQTDVFKIIIVEPGQTPGTNIDEFPSVGNYPTAGFTGNFSCTLDAHQMGGQCDIYVITTTQTGTTTIKIQKVGAH